MNFWGHDNVTYFSLILLLDTGESLNPRGAGYGESYRQRMSGYNTESLTIVGNISVVICDTYIP